MKQSAVSSNLSGQLIQLFGQNSDFVHQEYMLFGYKAELFYFQSLVDIQKTLVHLQQFYDSVGTAAEDFIQASLACGGNSEIPESELAGELIDGKLVVLPQTGHNHRVVFEPVSPSIQRSITSPQNDNVIQSSFDAFTEALPINLSLLRTKLKNERLIVKTFTAGGVHPRQIGVCYIEGIVVEEVISDISAKIERIKTKSITNVQELLKMLKLPLLTPMPVLLSSELPTETVKYLEEGRVVLFIDEHPFALAVPAIIRDLWSIQADYNYPLPFTVAIRLIRIMGIFIASIMPALYVALVNVNPESLRIQLALSISKSREAVPYPAIIEVVMMLLVLEMLIESSIRLPKSIGPTVTTVGGIVLGQAVVQAELVSNLLIIILAVTAISNFSMTGYQNTILVRLVKYFMLLLGSMLGVLGIAIGIMLVIIYFSGLTICKVPYISFSLKGRSHHE
ncbi:spore germination protein [Paenibacillus thalictri]|uniref:spore germination protein n=1 Tax=Paenibacillus thalictri TaxID=2527873 RepID=UPI0013EF340E|nr:spore germination protein [Paenibacillus thalictri]